MRVETFASMEVFRDWRRRRIHNPSCSFTSFVEELDDRSREHGCVSTLLIKMLMMVLAISTSL
jgi:hypothetical protein